MKIFLCFLALTLFAFSCRRRDCFDLPDPTVFEFVNTNGQNVIADSTLPLSSSLIMEDIGDTLFRSLQYDVTSDSKLAIKELGWYNGTKKYRFFTSDTTFYFFVYSSKNPSSDCDNAYKIDSISFTDVAASKKADFYQIIVR